MRIFRRLYQQWSKRQPSRVSLLSHRSQLQTFILEPILTPSGVLDNLDDTPGPELSEIDPLDLTSVVADLPDPDLPAESLEPLSFVENSAETAAANSSFGSGVFTVGEGGTVSVDFLFDGGAYRGQLALFKLDGLEHFDLTNPDETQEFIQAAANRALSNSEDGYIVISDYREGARFTGDLGERNWNQGDYLGSKTFELEEGDRFGLMLVPKGTVKDIARGTLDPAKRPLFSIAAANPQQAFHFGQLGDTTDDGTTFAIEDLRVDIHSDRDYNDLIVQIGGATTTGTRSLSSVINPDLDWRPSDLGEELLAFVGGDSSGGGDPPDIDPPDIVAALANDTGLDNSDGITTDPTITGSITDASEIASFRAGFNDTPLTDFVDVTPSLQPDGSFVLDPVQLDTIAGEPLADGTYTLHLQASDAGGLTSDLFNLEFTLETLDPNAPDAPAVVLLSPDNLTTNSTPMLFVAAEPDSQIQLFLDGVPINATVVDDLGLATIETMPLSNGTYELTATATDLAGNTSSFSEPLTIAVDTDPPIEPIFALDPASDTDTVGDLETRAETVTLVGQTEANATVELVETGAITTADATGRFSFVGVALASGPNSLTVQAGDGAGNISEFSQTITRVETFGIEELSPANAEEFVSLTRETIVRFTTPVDPTTLNEDSFYLIANGERIPGRIVVSSTEQFATFYYDDPLPASTAVRIVLEGDKIIGRDGNALDGDGDGIPGGTATAQFSTQPLTRIPDTNVFGYVFDSHNTNADGSNIPIVGATIRVDGLPGVTAVTDENGFFQLEDMPAPDFFVHIDGSTATNAPDGTTYATLGKPFHSVPGQTTQLTLDGDPFNVFLPPIATADFQPLSATEETNVGFGAAGLSQLEELFPDLDPTLWQQLQVTFPANSAQDEFGNPASQATIVPVDPERLPAPLPPNLDPKLVVSIQAPGANTFDVPAPVTFPNLDGLAPGEQSLIFSFNHDAGRWDVIGTGTVSDDGLTIVSDPGVGIRAPGWHFPFPGCPKNEGPPGTSPPKNKDEFDEVDILFRAFIPPEVVSLLPNTVIPLLAGILSSPLIGLRGDEPFNVKDPAAVIGRFLELIALPFPTLANFLKSFRTEQLLNWLVVDREDLPEGARRLDWTPPLVEGDDRGFGFQAPAKEEGRVAQHFTVDLDPGNTSPLETHHRKWGESAIFPHTAGRYVEGKPYWWWELTQDVPDAPAETVETTKDSNYFEITHREGHVTVLDLTFSGALPLVPAAPKLEADLQVTIAQPPGRQPVIKLAGEHDAFPAYELYANGELIHGYNPADVPGKKPFDLAGNEVPFIERRRLETDWQTIPEETRPFDPVGVTTPFNALAADSGLERQTGDHYYALLNTESGEVEQRGIAPDGMGLQNVVLTPHTDYELLMLQPETKWVGSRAFTTGRSGASSALGEVLIGDFDFSDLDGDGLGDIAELILGTDASSADTDGDGIADTAEFDQGLDPLGGFGFPTGLIASLSLPGEANAVVVEGSSLAGGEQTAYVATGSHGLAIVDVSQFDNPISLGQLELSGNAVAVAVDAELQIAAVATGNGGLHLIDISDPLLPTLQTVIDGFVTHVEVVDGIAYITDRNILKAIDLLTGEELQQLQLPGGGTATGLAREGSRLYAFVNDSDVLSTIDVSTPGKASVLGQLDVPIAASQVGVAAGNGIVYLAGSGLRTVDVSDPTQPVLISDADVPFTARDVALNGSGLALVAGEDQGVGIYNMTDPENTADLRFAVDTPGFAHDVAIASGIAYVADGVGGLHAINYLPFDNQGQAPTASISSPAIDLEPGTPGIQVLEGESIPIQVDVSDDVQVRNVELLVNGEVVRNDVSFPFDLSAIALSDDPNASVMEVQVRATDTGGNVSLSNLLQFDLVPDTFAPEIVSIVPAEGEARPVGQRTVRMEFSEALAAETVTLDSLQLLDSNGDPVVPTNLQLRSDDRFVQLTFDQLAVGNYELAIDAATVTDRAGNALGTGTLRHGFSVAPFRSELELSELNGDNGFVLQGFDRSDGLGVAVSGIGDFNGDGLEDLVVGNTRTKTYVLFGSQEPFPTNFDLLSLDGSNGFVVRGGFSLGDAVSGAGDINGDGLDDLIIGAPRTNADGFNSGRTYVVFGTTDGFSGDLVGATLDGSNGFRIRSIAGGDQSGSSVSRAGDINGDGLDDLIIGSPGRRIDGKNAVGEGYVVFGRPDGFDSVLNLQALDGSNGFVLNGAVENGQLLGTAVIGTGDINNDGIDDFAISAPGGSGGIESVYVVYGRTAGFDASLDLTRLDGTDGFIIQGGSSRFLGEAISHAGDINGDGLPDLIIGHRGRDSAYVIFGRDGAFEPILNVDHLDGSNGFVLHASPRSIDGIGADFVSGAGDVNGDGLDDLIVGAPYFGANDNQEAGASYVVFGRAGDSAFGASLDLTALESDQGFVIHGINAGDHSGDAVSGAGDFNGDGVDDLIVGARDADPNDTDRAGEAYVIFGNPAFG